MQSIKHCTLFFILILSVSARSIAQSADNPGTYMESISQARGDMDNKYLQYISAAAHGRRARKVEKLRLAVIDNIAESKSKTLEIPKYKGDNSLRQASIDYIQLCYRVFNEDYKKIVDMEELAEQSVDEMEAYLLLHEKVDEKLHEASTNLELASKAFAAKYNVNLIDDKSERGAKMELASRVSAYSNKVYFIFFKCNWEDNQMVKAMNDKKLTDIEQARVALLRYAEEGLKAMDTLRTFDNDPSLAVACRQILTFYKNEAQNDAPKITDYFLKQQEFEKAKQQFDASGGRNKADVDAYNKAVKDINAAVNSFNQLNSRLNKQRTQALNDWEDAQKKFSDDHVPHYK